MKFFPKFLFFFFAIAAMGQPETDSVENPEEKSRQFHIDEHKDTRETLKSDMDTFFNNLWQMMTKRNNETILKLEMHQEELSANLSREFNANMQRMTGELDTLNEKVTKIKENQENLATNLSLVLNENIRSLSLNLTKTFEENRLRTESEVKGQLGSLNETLQRNHQQISSSIDHLKTALILETEVEEVNEKSGTIEFVGGTNLHLGRKIWVLRVKDATSRPFMSFTLERNQLGERGRLSLWGSAYADGNQHTWTGSQTDWRKERRSAGHVILVTLLISPGVTQQPSFKLKFNTTSTDSTGFVYSSEVLFGEGRQVVSFPPNNTRDYPPKSWFTAIIAPQKGEPFGLTLKYRDLPGSPPNSCDNQFYVYFLNENPTGDSYRKLTSSEYKSCGKDGIISEPLGITKVAIIWFFNTNVNVGKGFRVQVN